MRAFAAGFLAVVALSTAALLAPVLSLFSLPLPPAIALPFVAAACAYGWAWLLCPPDGAEVYGALRGTIVAVLTYLSLMKILLVLGYHEVWLMIAGFVYTPFPWLALALGAVAGEANLRDTRSRVGVLRGTVVALLAYMGLMEMLWALGYRGVVFLVVGILYYTPIPWLALILVTVGGDTSLRSIRSRAGALFAIVRLVWTRCVAVVRATYARLDARAANPPARAIVTTVVSSCLLFTGGVLGLAWLPPGPIVSGAGTDAPLQLLPGMVALILALAAWMGGRVLLVIMPAAYRLRIALVSAILAGGAAVWFSINVA